jgi:regulator of replication initiation timing
LDDRAGTIFEDVSSKLDLVAEAVAAFGARLDTLRDEIFGQFAEVGGQIRFLSEQLSENRRRIDSVSTDLSAELARLGEGLGATRVEQTEQFKSLKQEIQRRAAEQSSALASEIEKAIPRGLSEVADTVKNRAQSAALAENLLKRFEAELKRTNKSLSELSRKFDRFDDRITVRTKDQDQRLRKLERRAG